MLAVQHRLPLARPRVRSARRLFRPGTSSQPYKLPHEVQDRLVAALQPFKNRESAYRLALFLARYHSNPDRILAAFMIDRRALADHPGLELTEGRVRGAIRVLEEIGYLSRAIPPTGSRYKATAEGLHRKPIAFVFGPEYGPLFLAANQRAGTARERVSGARRTTTAETARRPSTVLLQAYANLPKHRSEANPLVYLGKLARGSARQRVPQEAAPDSGLEAALERWRIAFEASR